MVIEQHDLPDILYTLKLRDLCGIGPAMERRLNQQNITSIEQLCTATNKRLHSVWGSIEGDRFYKKLRGEFLAETPIHDKKSISHSHVLAPNLRNTASAEAVLKKLLQKAAMRLRDEKLVARQLHVKIKYLDAPSWRDYCHCDDLDDSHKLILHLNQLLAHRPQHSKPFAVSVALLDLCERIGTTDDLFDTNSDEKALSSVMDSINQRFGFQKICYASSQNAAKSAPMRIAFTRIPDVAREDELFKRL